MTTTISPLTHITTKWANRMTGEEPQFRYYQRDQQHLLIVDQADHGRSALGIPWRGAGSSQEGDLLISEAEVAPAGFVEISEQEAYTLADTLPKTLSDESIGSHYRYSEFLLRKVLVARAATELATRSGNQEEQDLSISEIDSYERAITRRWTVQAAACRFDVGLLAPPSSDLVVLPSESSDEAWE